MRLKTKAEVSRGLIKAAEESRKERALNAMIKVRPWVSSAVMGAIPPAVAANFLIPATKEPGIARKSKIIAGIAALGAGAGVADKALKRWAQKNKRRKAAQEVLTQEKVSSAEGAAVMRKVAAFAADLRRLGMGGVRRPAFPTEDSKRTAFGMLRNSSKPGSFGAKTEPKHLIKPGPSIQQLAPKV